MNVRVLQASSAAAEGLRVTVTGAAAVTVTVAVSLLVGSARLVATTVQVFATVGAV